MANEDTALCIRSLDGAPPPEDMVAGLKSIASFSDDVKEHFWAALAPNLSEVVDEQSAEATRNFCEQRDISLDELAPAVKACRQMFLSAIAIGLPAQEFGKDLMALELGDKVISEVVLPCYEQAFNILRERILVQAVARHGHLVTDFDWRIDAIRASNRGRSLGTNLALITFDYREGAATKTITLQMLPETLARLHKELGTILG